jgi:dihydrofolate synthase / folylpolyglutamate synthase
VGAPIIGSCAALVVLRTVGSSGLSDHVAWVESLSPWPEEFGLERMQTLLRELGDPQLTYPSIHVVGTNGKSTTTRMAAALLTAAGLRAGAYTSPHVSGWQERIQIDGAPVDFETAVGGVRPAAERLEATQFEVLTAAALAEFAAAEVDVAVVEAGLGGRFDATNVLRSPVQVLTNVALDHTDVLGETREAIAEEKLAVVQPGAIVVLGEPEWREAARAHGAGAVTVVSRSNLALAVAAAEAFLGRQVDPRAAQEMRLPGRFERHGEEPLEIWDGAHNPAGLGYLLPRLPSRRFVVVASILREPEKMLAGLSAVGETLIATRSSNPRALPADELERIGSEYFDHVERVDDPADAVARARELAGPAGAVLVTGSLYLLADLSQARVP